MNWLSLGKKSLIIFVLAFCALSVQAQLRISGIVTDSLGNPIFKANIVEMDVYHRILNQTTSDKRGNFVMSVRDTLTGYLRISANGYVSTRDRIRKNLQLFNIKLEERKASRLSQILKQTKNGNDNSIQSKNLLCGRSGARVEPWLVTIFPLTDSLFVLQLPVKAIDGSALYKEGRTMTFLDANDYPIITCYNGEDAVAFPGAPNDYDRESLKSMQSIGNFRVKSGTHMNAVEDDVYFYPQFILSLEDIEVLMAQVENLARVTVDTEAGDNYWFVYPMDTFAKEFKKILSKLTKK